jgi:hypothetical protein
MLETSGRTDRPNDVGKLIEVRQNLFGQLDAALVIVQIAIILKLALGQLQLCAPRASSRSRTFPCSLESSSRG